ncbi:MAG: hypothetical protein HZB13_16250 [Acidobacteria bacterium]|nr:hypothetical protein [Acidobacteriota bacterium]
MTRFAATVERFLDAGVVLRKEFVQAVKGRRVFWILAAVAAMMHLSMILAASPLKHSSAYRDVSVVLQTLFAHYPIPTAIIFFINLAQPVFIKERSNRSLESLLATPLHPWSIWLGKSLSCWAIGWTGSGLACCAAWFTFGLTLGTLIPPGAAALAFYFTVGPMLALGILLLLGAANLILRNAAAANAFCIYFAIGYMFLASFWPGSLAPSWRTAAWFLLAAAATNALAFSLASRFTAEEMILASSRCEADSQRGFSCL